MSYNHDYVFRTIIIGDSKSGKSTFCKTYANGYSSVEKIATIGVDFFSKIHKMDDDKIIKLNLWDTAGQEVFRSIIRSYFRDICGAIILFDITDANSFINVENWLKEIDDTNNCNHEHIIILVGNKIDLQNKRCISHEEALKYAKSKNMLYVESSSYNSEKVESIMHHFYTSIYQKFLENKICKGIRNICSYENNLLTTSTCDINNIKKSKCC